MNNQNAIHIDTPAAGITAEPSATESAHTQAVDQATPLASTPEEIWQQHCMKAVKSFLKNVVIVDNEPYTPPEKAQRETDQASLVIPDDDGMGGVQAIAELGPLVAPKTQGALLAGDADLTAHRLDIIEISDAFADAGLSCAFVLPKNIDKNREAKKSRALKAAKAADVLIIDWQLEKGSSVLTQAILKELAEQDTNEGSRLRLICVYTGTNTDETLLIEAVSALRQGGINLDVIDSNTAKNATCLLATVNKYSVPGKALPDKIITLFTKLNDGLIPSFALASVGAIRKNTHHLLTRFERDLDSAYIANRLITDPPEDIAELMRDLLVAECENSLSYDAVADEYLTLKPIEKWLELIKKTNASIHQNKSTVLLSNEISQMLGKLAENRKAIATQLGVKNHDVQKIEQAMSAQIEILNRKESKIVVKNKNDVNMEIISKLLNYGIDEKGVKSPPSDVPQIEIHERDRKHISTFLSGSEDKSRQRENKFSRMVALRREAFGPHKAPWSESWLPSITTGTILKSQKSYQYIKTECKHSNIKRQEYRKHTEKYYICLTPACDTLRLNSNVAFVFIEARKNQKNYNVVIKDEDGSDLYLKFSTKTPEISTFNFIPHSEKKRVVGVHASVNKEKSIFKFFSINKRDFIWMGEMRYSRAVSEIAKISSTWMRIGLIDSEHLRIAAKG